MIDQENQLKQLIAFHEKVYLLSQVTKLSFFAKIYDIYKLVVKSRDRNPRTPFNSTAGDSKRTSPPLPPIKRPLASNISSVILESMNEY